MSFHAKLFIDGKEIIVLDCSFEIGKKADDTGKPMSTAYGGQIEISFEMSEKDGEFFKWAQDNVLAKDGYIIFYKDNVMAIKYKLEFEQGFCLNFSANYSSEGRFMAHILISAFKLKFGGEEHTNRWGITNK